jgi:hypothetical protein
VAKSDQPAPSPRFRGFRIAMYAVYLTVVSIFSLLIIVSVVRSVIAMSPGHRPTSDKTLSTRECVDLADGLWRDLEARRKDLGSTAPVRNADNTWPPFREAWLQREREAEAMCAIDSQNRAPLKEVFKRLDQAMDLYTTHTVQYAGEIGPTIDALREAMAEARKDASK